MCTAPSNEEIPNATISDTNILRPAAKLNNDKVSESVLLDIDYALFNGIELDANCSFVIESLITHVDFHRSQHILELSLSDDTEPTCLVRISGKTVYCTPPTFRIAILIRGVDFREFEASMSSGVLLSRPVGNKLKDSKDSDGVSNLPGS